MRKISFGVFLFGFLLMPVLAEAQGINPTEVESTIGDKPPYATGKFSWLGFGIYNAKLWTKAKHWSYKNVFALNLEYLRDIDAEDLVENSITEIRRIRRTSEDKLDAYRLALEKVFPDVKEGDTVTAVYYPKNKVVFYYNGKKYGEVNMPGFPQDFLAIWLDPKTKGKELWENIENKNGE